MVSRQHRVYILGFTCVQCIRTVGYTHTHTHIEFILLHGKRWKDSRTFSTAESDERGENFFTVHPLHLDYRNITADARYSKLENFFRLRAALCRDVKTRTRPRRVFHELLFAARAAI